MKITFKEYIKENYDKYSKDYLLKNIPKIEFKNLWCDAVNIATKDGKEDSNYSAVRAIYNNLENKQKEKTKDYKWIENPGAFKKYWEKILSLSNGVSISSRKFYQSIIDYGFINGKISEKQYLELKRLARGDFKRPLKESITIKSETSIIKDWAYKYARRNHEGFNSYDDAIEHLDYLFETDFPDGLNNIPNKIELYRYLDVESKKDINLEELGICYIADNHYLLSSFEIQDFFEKIGLNPDEDSNIYMVTIITSKNDINFEETIINRLSYPTEYEFTLNKNAKYKVKKIEKVDKNLYYLR